VCKIRAYYTKAERLVKKPGGINSVEFWAEKRLPSSPRFITPYMKRVMFNALPIAKTKIK